MGMYTGLRCKVIIKKEYIKDIEELLQIREWRKCSNLLFQSFGKSSRADFIPYGSLAYMPDCWEEPKGNNGEYSWENLKDTDGFEYVFYPKTGLWCFQCSLKNYENDIENFINDILNIIAKKIIHLEVLYEENSVSDLYNFKNGKIKKLDYGIRYYEDISKSCYMPINPDEDNNIRYEDYDFSKDHKYRKGLNNSIIGLSI